MTNKIRIAMLVIIMAMTAVPIPAYAYIDPGSGSMFFQILIGFILGFLYVIRNFIVNTFKKIRNLFIRKEQDEETE